MKLHAIENRNGDKNGKLFGNEMNSAYQSDSKEVRLIFLNVWLGLKKAQPQCCKGKIFQTFYLSLKLALKSTKTQSGRIQTLERAILAVLRTSPFHFGHIAHIILFTGLTFSA